MTIGSSPSHRAPFRPVLLLALVALCAVDVLGAPSIAVQIGFSGHVLPERYAPFRMQVRGYEGAADARAVVTQPLGNEWRDTATVRQEIDLLFTADGSASAVLPIYEPLNPIAVALIDQNGETVARTDLDLRAGRHLDPFPLLYGSYPESARGASSFVIATDLPSNWWAYDAVHSLWISSPPPPAAWTAIAQWIVGGGSVVLLSGPDYIRFDSPILRRLLPLSAPAIGRTTDGLHYLGGGLRAGASAYLARAELPLLVSWPYGAGHVAVVTLRPTDLSEEELDQIWLTVPGSSRVSMAGLTESLLGALPLARPTRLAALFLTVACIAGLITAAAVRKRYRRSGEVATVGLFLALAVSSGFYANRTTQMEDVYSMNTHLSILASYGMHTDTLSFYSHMAQSLVHSVGSETIPAQAPPTALADHPLYAFMPQATATPWAYHHSAYAGHVVTAVADIGQKTFYTFAASTIPLRISNNATADVTVLDNQAPEPLAHCWVIVDGKGTCVSPVPTGVHSFSLEPEQDLESLWIQASEPSSTVLRHLADQLPFQQGVWLVAVSDVTSELSPETARKVRHLSVYVVQGDPV